MGTYTAQAEQDDLTSPPDLGFSPATTFIVNTSGGGAAAAAVVAAVAVAAVAAAAERPALRP